MGHLAGHLQREFRRLAPAGWECRREEHVLARELAQLLGYAPRADVVLDDGAGRRLWVEFEVSRADPVANHAKFATAHLFQPQGLGDVFVSMVSRHVDRGRRNLAAGTIHVMRRLGMTAVQTVLLPGLPGEEVKRLNHLSLDELAGAGLDVGPEVERVMAVSAPLGSCDGHRIYLAGEVVEVLLNAQAWNDEVASDAGRALWGRRRGQYFVYVPYTGQFAPSKFCAFLPVAEGGGAGVARMSLGVYVQLGEEGPRFDGHTARRHLTDRLGMVEVRPGEYPRLGRQFEEWSRRVCGLFHPCGEEARLICPPDCPLG